MFDGLIVAAENAKRQSFDHECGPEQRTARAEPKRGIVMWEGLLRLAGAKNVGPTEAKMSPGEVGIDRDRGLHFTNRHF